MFQISLSTEKNAASALGILAAIGAAGMASQANASTSITIDPYVPASPDANSPIIKSTNSTYWPNQLWYYDSWTSWQSVKSPTPGPGREFIGFFSWDYDFSALSGKTILSATLVLGPIDGTVPGMSSYGYFSGNHITVAALTSAVDLRDGFVGVMHDPYTNSVTEAFPNGGTADGSRSVAMPFDMKGLVDAWQANPSSFHGVEIWSTDVPSIGLVWSPGNSYGPTNGGKLMITYEDSTPEPASLGIGASLGGFVLLRRRRR